MLPRRFQIPSPLPPDRVRTCLREVTAPQRSLFEPVDRPFTGTVSEDGFRIMRTSRGRNSFRPVVSGRITPAGSGSRVEGTLGLHPVVVGLVAVLVLLPGRLVVGSLLGEGGTDPVLVTIAGVMLLFATVVTLAFYWECRRTVADLAATLDANPAARVSGVGAIAGVVAVAVSAPLLPAQVAGLPLPPTAGVTVVQTLASSDGDRESVHTVIEVKPDGLLWNWSLAEVTATGDTIRERFGYKELFRDLADAIRLRGYHEKGAPLEHPGYTMHAVSRAVYRRLLAAGADTFQIMAVRSPKGGGLALGFGGGRATPIRWRGTLSLGSRKTVAFPLLVNGRRREVPAWDVRGHFTGPAGTWDPQFLILADSTYPLVLKWVGAHDNAGNVLQTIRLDGGGVGLPKDLEVSLGTGCRAELPGVYFGFNSAALNEASEGPIAAVAELLARHPDWTLTVEGHTDSVGTAAANRELSERRVEAVVARLVTRHRVNPARLKTAGQGSARPREPNATIEGRARNRRVELVRDCDR